MATLQGATSIVDFLKSKNFRPTPGESLPLFEQRKQIFNASGLGSTLGDFRGTAEQNTQLLNFLSNAEKQAGVNLNPGNLTDVISIARGGGAAPAQAGGAATPRVQSIDEFLTPGSVAARNAAAPPGSASVAPSEVVSDTAPRVDQATLTKLFDPLAGRDIAQEALSAVTGSPTFPLQQEAVEAQKAKIKLGAERETEDFIKNIASRGLFFSGAKKKGVSEIEVDKMADLLDVDRRFALLITQGLETAAQNIAKDAQKGSENAMKALESLGFVVNPLTGAIEPTAQERRFQQTEARQVQADERQQTQEAVEFAAKHNIQTPFYFIGKVGFRTSDRKPYGTPQEMFADMGVGSFEEARQKGLVSDVDPGAVGVKTTITSANGRRIILTYDETGNVINTTDIGSSTSGSKTSTVFKQNQAVAVPKTNHDGSFGADYFYTDLNGVTRPITEQEFEQIEILNKDQPLIWGTNIQIQVPSTEEE